MRAPRLMAASVVTLALAACSAPPQREFSNPEVDAITKTIQEFITAYNAKDAAKMATFFAGDARVMPPNASTVIGTQAIQNYYDNRFSVQGASDLTIDAKDITGSGMLAYASGDYSLKLAPAGGTERRDRGKLILIFREMKDKWLLEYLIFSSDFPPGPPPPSV